MEEPTEIVTDIDENDEPCGGYPISKEYVEVIKALIHIEEAPEED